MVAGTELTIRPMQSKDIAQVLALEAGSLVAWSREHLEDELQQPAGFQFIAAGDKDGKVSGVLCGRVAADEAEILKLSVAADQRRKGIGGRLLDFALDYCRSREVINCYLELRVSNAAARELYASRGFRRAGIRKNYYESPGEDAMLMRLDF